MTAPRPTSSEKHRYTLSASMLPGIQGVCFLFAMGILRRALDLAVIFDVLGFIGLIVGFGISTRRFFAKEPPKQT